MKIKSILALAFILPLVACNSSKTQKSKEISKEEAIERNSGVTVQSVVEHCGQYVTQTWDASISDKTGVFAQFSDEEINSELNGETVYDVEEECDWLIATPEYLTNGFVDSEENTCTFYASGNHGLIIECVSCWREVYEVPGATYRVITNETSKSTFGEYGQMIKWYGEYEYTINPEYYPEGNVTGGFKMKWSETLTYTNTPPAFFKNSGAI